MDTGAGLDMLAGSALALMNVPPPESATAPNGLQGLSDGLFQLSERLHLLFRTMTVSAPAIASMISLWAGLRWPAFGRSLRWNMIAAIPLAIASSLVVPFLVSIFGDVDTSRDMRVGLYASYGLVAIALAVQLMARGSFSLGRAVGIGVAAVTVPTILLIDGYWQSSS